MICQTYQLVEYFTNQRKTKQLDLIDLIEIDGFIYYMSCLSLISVSLLHKYIYIYQHEGSKYIGTVITSHVFLQVFQPAPTCSKRAEVKGAPLTQKEDASIVPPIPPQTSGEKK